MLTYTGLPLDTHSNLRYCPSCGIISECVISRWGASVKRRQVLQALPLQTKYNYSSVAIEQLLAFSSCCCFALVLIPYLQTNPALIQRKCKAKPPDIKVLSIIVFLLSVNPAFQGGYDCTHSGPPGPQLSCRG